FGHAHAIDTNLAWVNCPIRSQAHNGHALVSLDSLPARRARVGALGHTLPVLADLTRIDSAIRREAHDRDALRPSGGYRAGRARVGALRYAIAGCIRHLAWVRARCLCP